MSDLVSMARTSSLVVMFSLSAVAVSARFIAAGIFTERVSLPSLLKALGVDQTALDLRIGPPRHTSPVPDS